MFVLGAGVAGLQAIATARRLGAVVTGFDARAAVSEQVKSLGANFVEIPGVEANGQAATRRADARADRQPARRDVKAIGASDVVITTAAVPGRKAPMLVTARGRAMAPGSVIVDLAAETGGNCELTVRRPDGRQRQRREIIGAPTCPRPCPPTPASSTRATSRRCLTHLIKDGALRSTRGRDARGATIAHDGTIVHEPTRAALERSAKWKTA